MIRFNNKKIGFILLMVLSLIIINNSFFIHFHELDNGKIIKHTHPYNKIAENSSSQHQHSDKELIFYNIISSLLNNLVLISILIFITLKKTINTKVFENYQNHFSSQEYYKLFFARPPPKY